MTCVWHCLESHMVLAGVGFLSLPPRWEMNHFPRMSLSNRTSCGVQIHVEDPLRATSRFTSQTCLAVEDLFHFESPVEFIHNHLLTHIVI